MNNELNKKKFHTMIKSFDFECNIVSKNTVLVKSKHDNWKLELINERIRLHHKNKTFKPSPDKREKYHYQKDFNTSWKDVLIYIKKHDKFSENNPQKLCSKTTRRLFYMDRLFDMIDNKQSNYLKMC